jgi:hypothetical protein
MFYIQSVLSSFFESPWTPIASRLSINWSSSGVAVLDFFPAQIVTTSP